MGENRSACSSTSNSFEYPNIYKPRCFGKSVLAQVLSVDLQERRTDKRPRDIYEELAMGAFDGCPGPKDSSSDGKLLYGTSDDLMRIDGWILMSCFLTQYSES